MQDETKRPDAESADNAETTNIEIIVFEDEDGLDVEMEVVDEFSHEGKHYVALRPGPDEIDFDAEEDSISFFEIIRNPDESDELFELVEDDSLCTILADLLESRLLNVESR